MVPFIHVGIGLFMLASDQAAALSRATLRYRDRGRFARMYVASKLRRDPVYGDLLALDEPLGDVVDIGCGRGQLAALLLESGMARRVTGYDRNRAHLDQAEAAMADLPFQAWTRDLAADQSVPAADTVVIMDVLYQLTTEVQHTLLEQAGRAARNLLLIRAMDPGRGARGAFAAWLERRARLIWPSSGTHVNPLSVAAIVTRMTKLGFTVETSNSSRGTPFSNVLLLGRRPRG